MLPAGQVHAGPGGLLRQVDRSVCAQMQGRDMGYVALLHGSQMCVPVCPAGYLCARHNEAHMAAGWGNASWTQVRVCAHVLVFVAVSRGQVWVVVHFGLLY